MSSLDASARDGRLGVLCERFHVELLVLFGSAVSGEAPRDVDLAAGFVHGADKNVVAFVNALTELVPGDHIDLLDLNTAGPVARVEALTKGRVLYEARPSIHAEREIAALGEYLDTAYLREMLLQEPAR